MATWGDFIKEVPIVNKRSEGIFVKADHVLDLWEERNRLRKELALLQQGAGGAAAGGASAEELRQAAAAEREACAREIEEMADALGQEAEPNPQLITLLQAVARLLRDKTAAGAAAEAAGASPEAPMAEPLDEAAGDAPLAEPLEAERIEPTDAAAQAEPLADRPAVEPPTAEFAAPPLAEPVEEDPKPAGPTLAELLEREGIPPRQS